MGSNPKYSSSLFIAKTRGGVESPVFFDVHTPIYNVGKPVITITGSPGLGKTFAGQIITTISAIMGKTVVVIDYKGDMLSIYELREQLGVPVRIWDLSSKKQKGVLDPYILTNDKGEQLNTVIELISLFTGGLDRDSRMAITPIIMDVTESVDPTLMKVVSELRRSQDKIARAIGSELNTIRQMPFASLCFSTTRNEQKNVISDKGITIATLAGMDLPSDAEEAKSTNNGRLGSGILYLLTDYIRRLLSSQDVNQPKLFVIDEAWSVLATEAGLKIIKEVALLGRSKNLATLLITQSPTHIEAANIKNTIGTRFSFGVSKEESASLVRDMNLPEGEFDDMIANLEPKTCIMSDYKGDFGFISFFTWRKDWIDTFATNPYDLMMRNRQKKETERRRASENS